MVASCISLSGSTLAAQSKTPTPREQIGEVLGKPVYRDQLDKLKDLQLSDALQHLFGYPLFNLYHREHQAQFKATPQEIKSAMDVYSKDPVTVKEFQEIESLNREILSDIKAQLKQADLSQTERQRLKSKEKQLQQEIKLGAFQFYVIGLIEVEKFERHLYLSNGRGRIRAMMMGEEAFDARHQWLKAQEKLGKFKITDPQLRDSFYKFWTDQQQRGHILNSKDSIKSFLEPVWSRPLAEK
ncbi:hypothetical protein [Gimesia panareensis]|uniref:hypothetical protein n=1 Tax=Gimesia panareensis TaxID=2527978 RepID=UPI00119FA4C2|nr:hypothetical protein [Gimesia panareensis]